MKVKGKNKLLTFFTFLPLIVTLISLSYLPDSIPAHYGVDGKVTRWVSKYETLIIPVLGIIIYGISLIFTNYVSNKTKNYKIKNLNFINILLVFIFNILTMSFLISDFGKITNISDTFSSKLIYFCLGLMFMLLGHYITKFPIKNLFGIRKSKKLSNMEVLLKAHKTGGKVLMIFGGIFSILSLFVSDNISMLILVACLIIITIVVSIYPIK